MYLQLAKVVCEMYVSDRVARKIQKVWISSLSVRWLRLAVSAKLVLKILFGILCWDLYVFFRIFFETSLAHFPGQGLPTLVRAPYTLATPFLLASRFLVPQVKDVLPWDTLREKVLFVWCCHEELLYYAPIS